MTSALKPERVTEYFRHSHNLETGRIVRSTCRFTAMQAFEAGSVLHEDGLPLKAALRLMEAWNKKGATGPIRYEYGLIQDGFLMGEWEEDA